MKTKRKGLLATGQALAILGAFAAGAVVAPTAAQAVSGSYDKSKAIAYAAKYSCNGNESCRNPAYKSAGNDCASFVSQALEAGGLWTDSVWNVNPWTKQLSDAWGQTGKLATWLNDNATWHYDASPSKAVSPASVGSVIQYDWGGGEGWSHTALLTGTGAYANYKDPNFGYYKDAVKNNYGDRVTQHSTDRDGSPWNLGYWTYSPSWRASAKMRYLYPFQK